MSEKIGCSRGIFTLQIYVSDHVRCHGATETHISTRVDSFWNVFTRFQILLALQDSHLVAFISTPGLFDSRSESVDHCIAQVTTCVKEMSELFNHDIILFRKLTLRNFEERF